MLCPRTYLGLLSDSVYRVQFLMGLSILVAASRQSWAFSRDGALPFSGFFRPISQRFGYIPLRTVWGCVLLAAVLGLLSLIAPAAAQALFSLAVAGNNLAWGVPIMARVVWGQKKFKPGMKCLNDCSFFLHPFDTCWKILMIRIMDRAILHWRSLVDPHRLDRHHLPSFRHITINVPSWRPRPDP